MSRKVIGGLIQCSNPLNDESLPVATIQRAMFRKAPAAHRGGRQAGVQILCLQEIFNGPYFCPVSRQALVRRGRAGAGAHHRDARGEARRAVRHGGGGSGL
jgi:hypothetical protein